MTATHQERGFVGRFDHAWSKIRRAEVACGVLWTVLVAACGIGLVAALDFRWELAWAGRAAGGTATALAALVTAFLGVGRPMRWWSRPRTAVEVEHRYPQLGQRIRTVVQYAGQTEQSLVEEGVMPSLVTALEEETDRNARPLDLDALVPRRRLALAAVLAAVSILLLVIGFADWEWRTAIGRALLGNAPYTRLTVEPGDVVVDRDGEVTVAISIEGRVPDRVALQLRPTTPAERAPSAAETDWEERTPDVQDSDAAATGTLFTTKLEKLKEPLEYRAVAGRIESQVSRISIRIPIAIKKFEVDLAPPEYTAVERSTVPGGDLEVIEGTEVQFRIEFDRPAEAKLLLGRELDEPDRSVEPVFLTRRDKEWTAKVKFTDGRYYRIVARAEDGTGLPETGYRVRVRKDQPPRVTFLEPDEALEVHPLAEVLMRARVDDDFGLTRAGVVFRVNSGEEHTLLLKDFAKGALEKRAGKKPANVTQATLEEALLLEQFALAQTDSVTYFAFAEDNYPGRPHRTETDLRFIDIRPFKRIYKIGGT